MPLVVWCPECWQENPVEATHCEACGAELWSEKGDRVTRLIRALHHPVAETRQFVAVCLGKTNEPRAIQALGEAAQRAIAERDWALLDGVTEGLAECGTTEVRPWLEYIAKHGYVGARRLAERALAKPLEE